MADIFISYAREDREWVEKLAKAYTDNGYSVWWDWDLLVGKRYRETIETELQTCKATVVVWSEHSIRSDFVRDEAEEGQQRNILVPLLKDNVRPPAGFRQLQTADLTKWNGAADHVEFQRMMRGLQHVVAAAPSVEKDDDPAAAPAPVASAVAVAEEVTSTPVTTPVAPAPIPVPQPVVQAKTPEPATKPLMGTSPPPPATVVATPAGSSTAPLPSPFAAMKVPPSSHPVWRYVAIGAVALVGLIYVVGLLVPSNPTPISKPSTVASAPTAPATPPANGGNTPNGGSTTTTPATNPPATNPPANGTPTLGTKPTDMSGANATVAPILQKAEQADSDARAQANAGVAAEKAVAAGTATDANGMALGSLTLADGTYGGQVYSGTAQGVGTLSMKNGNLYAGQFDEGVISGRGVVTFGDKTTSYGYSGQFAAGNFNGYGVYYFSNGWRMEGMFKDGQLDGLGARIDPNGKITEQGTYENSTLKP